MADFVYKTSCPACGSRDNLAVYNDGSTYCFGASCDHRTGPTDGSGPAPTRPKANFKTIQGAVKALPARGITEETARRFGYQVGRRRGSPIHIANYIVDGEIVAQHLRTPDKDFPWRGDKSRAPLFGEWLWSGTGKMVVLTEGEIDAMTVDQVQGNRWPVGSLRSGAKGAEKDIKERLKVLLGYEKVVLMFDDDEPGREAAQAAAKALPVGKAYIATIPGFKDANAAHQAKRDDLIIRAIWEAKPYRPDGMVSLREAIQSALGAPEWGLPWFMEGLNQASYGRRWGAIYGVGAGTGIGKTDWFLQQVAFDLVNTTERVVLMLLEDSPDDLVRQLGGKVAGRLFNVPEGASEALSKDLEQALAPYLDRVDIYDSWGTGDWEEIVSHIRFMAAAGARLVYLDPLTGIVDPSREKEHLEEMMKEMAGLAHELDIIIHFSSHLATPGGGQRPHEEGGRVMIRHFKGSRTIGFWSHGLIGLERDMQSDDEDARLTTHVRVLKYRKPGGRAVGMVFHLKFNTTTGMLEPVEYEPDEGDSGPDDFGFTTENE